MSEKDNQPDARLSGDSQWWENSSRALMYSHEKSSRDSSTTSFLSCAFFDINDEQPLILSESATSTTSIKPGDDVVIEGSGEFLVPVAELAQYLSSMPSGDIVVEFYTEDMTYKVTNESGSVTFSAGLVEIINEDMTPSAVSQFPEDAVTISVKGQELIDQYRSASTMALPMEKDPLSGQDPMAGCYVSVNDLGIQIFSLSGSAAESLIYNPDSERDPQMMITAPNTTLPRLGVFSHSDVQIAIEDNNTLHISDDGIHMTITALNIGDRTIKINVGHIIKVMEPAWDSGVVDVSVPATEFFKALDRADSVGGEYVDIEVTDTSLMMSASGKHGKGTPFMQKMTCSTEWLDDADHWLSFQFDLATMKSLAPTVGRREKIRFRVSLKPNGSPWALIIITDEHDDSDPHDYHMIALYG